MNNTHTMTTKVKSQERNAEINKAFNDMYNEGRTLYGKISFSGIYFALSKRYGLSVMQIRRIVRGY